MAYRATKRIYVNADRSKVVEEGDPEAAFLLVAEGGELDDETAARYGLTSGARTGGSGGTPPTPPQAPPEAAQSATEGEKGQAAPANKALSAPEIKAPADRKRERER